ncbi:MAG TPA: hypothetical protein VME68_11535 [Acidobacteriaceae bacterium]|nr:hypothetical protein [Acidobacteriaceae bacterium]
MDDGIGILWYRAFPDCLDSSFANAVPSPEQSIPDRNRIAAIAAPHDRMSWKCSGIALAYEGTGQYLWSMVSSPPVWLNPVRPKFNHGFQEQANERSGTQHSNDERFGNIVRIA